MMVALSIIAIIYGAYMALAQVDLKKLIAYSSVSHMGFVTLGLFVLNQQGIEGAVIQMVNHGITTGGLFLCVGIIYERTHSRLIADNVGLAAPMPQYATLPDDFRACPRSASPAPIVLSENFSCWSARSSGARSRRPWPSLGIILAAAYILWMIQRVVFGVPSPHHLPKLWTSMPTGNRPHWCRWSCLVFCDRHLPESLADPDACQAWQTRLLAMSRTKPALRSAPPSAQHGTVATAAISGSASLTPSSDRPHRDDVCTAPDLLALCFLNSLSIVTACLVLVLDPITPASQKDLLAWLSVGALALCLGLTAGRSMD